MGGRSIFSAISARKDPRRLPVGRGAHTPPDRIAGIAGLAVNGSQQGRHVGMPPYGPPTRFLVGRGAHTPPDRAAGTAGLAVNGSQQWRHVGMPPYGPPTRIIVGRDDILLDKIGRATGRERV